MDDTIRKLVRDRAANRCEYCHLLQHQVISICFHIEHIRARQHGGTDESDNLALACQQCNLFKGPNQSGYDPITGSLVRLFHPRLDDWNSHFRLEGPTIVGLTPSGRATVDLLRINSSDYLELRELEIQVENGS